MLDQGKEKLENYVRDNVYDTEMGTGGSATNKRHSITRGQENVSNDERIRQLQAEIDRLSADKGKGRKSPRKHPNRE